MGRGNDAPMATFPPTRETLDKPPICNLHRKTLNARAGQEHSTPRGLIILMPGHESQTMARPSDSEAPLMEVQA